MAVQNSEVAAALVRLADLLEIEGDNPFRVRAYRNAAQVIANLSRSVADVVAAGEDLTQFPGIGEAIARKTEELVRTGHLGALEKEQHKVPGTLVDLLRIPALGPKRVHLLYEKLKIATPAQLAEAAAAGKLRELPGFGEKTEQKILAHLSQQQAGATRVLLSAAEETVAPLLDALRAVRGAGEVTAAGSFRRRQETVGDIDILASGGDAPALMDRLTGHEDVREVLARGETKSAVVFRTGLQVDLRVVPRASYGAALHYFTGSKAHNIALRTRGVKRGLTINEYGVLRGEASIAGREEEEVFRSVDLPWIPPELRENRGEIEAAEEGRLPRLVERKDIRGDLHMHTTETDGRASLEEMAAAARAQGHEYIAIADHTQRMAMAHGQNATRLARQIRAIDRLNEKGAGLRVLKSAEVDILEDGSLDLSDDVLRRLDVVIVSVHTRLELSREKQTERVLRALENPCVNILAHPTGRLIGEREASDLDLERILRAAAACGCAMELNAHPLRLDLNDAHCRLARSLGVPVVISTDAHSPGELAHMRHGVDQARRGWLEAGDVLNTLPWPALQARLRRR